MIRRMTNSIAHRGPDDEGAVIFQENVDEPVILFGDDTPAKAASAPYRHCRPDQRIIKDIPAVAALGHRRLSIIDLSVAGHQPMCTPDGRYWMTYNGEVYNHPELRKELEGKGCSFKTNTDTEVVLQAYAYWGSNCLHRLNGMFAFAIVDVKEQRLFATRDRFGVKPLYFWKSPCGMTALASEIKQFMTLPLWKAKLNHQRAYDFLNWGMTDHGEETFFDGVKQLKAGHFFACSLNEHPSPKQWYSIPKYASPHTFEEAVTIFHDLFFDAVRMRLRADVEVGSCLSGGLDSSSIVCAVDRVLRAESSDKKQSTFTICSHEKEYDERKYVEEVVKGKCLGTHYIYPSIQALKESIQQLAYTQDEPFISTSIFAQWLIFKHVREKGIPVMLDGQGADEQLAGYHSFYGYKLFEHFKTMQWMELVREARAIKRYHHIAPYLMLGNRLLPGPLRNPIAKMMGRTTTRPRWLNFKKLNADYADPLKSLPSRSVSEWGEALIKTGNLPMLLRYEDRNSMAHSIEARTPFLDYRLVEFCINLPPEYKLKGPWTKKILRESMAPHLPQEIVKRLDKMAFVTAEESWMKMESQYFRALLDESIEVSKGIIRPCILSDYDKMVEGTMPFSYLYWRLISLGQWIKAMDVNVNPV